MLYPPSYIAILIFCIFVSSVLVLSFYLASKAKSARGFYAAHGQIPWFINGVAFAGDYLSAASFLGICGMIAFYGYDGFLYSIGFLAGWVVALFVIAEPIKRLGKFTFADALDSQFNSRGIKLAAAISTLVVSIFYLIPQMVGAGALIKPLLGLPAITLGSSTIDPFTPGVILVGGIVILIVVTAGMVSTTWVQFIKGSLLVLFCFILTIAILTRGLTVKPPNVFPLTFTPEQLKSRLAPGDKLLYNTGPWAKQPFARIAHADGSISVWRFTGMARPSLDWPAAIFTECQLLTITPDHKTFVNFKPQSAQNDLKPVGFVASLPDNQSHIALLSPVKFLATLENSDLGLPRSTIIKDALGTHTLFYPEITPGSGILVPGNHPMFAGLRSNQWPDRLNFISLMLALFCGTAALPHILIRYYTVKDQASARKSTVVGIIAIGFFYVLTLYLGLGAMTSTALDPADAATGGNMSAPLLAKSFGNLPFAFVSAIAFTTVLGTVSGLIMAAAGTVAHDLLHNLFQMNLDDHAKVRAGKFVSIIVGIIAIILGILFQHMNVSFLVGWAFNIAASANLPSIVMLLFWKRTTAKGIAASITIGLASSLLWIFLSADAFEKLYGNPHAQALLLAQRCFIPFNQPGLVTIPLAFLTLIVVSLFTTPRRAPKIVSPD